MNSKVRIQLDFETREARALDDLREKCGLRSRADAIRTALAVIDWVQTEASKGRRVLAVGDDDIAYLVVPGVTDRKGSGS